MRLPFQLEASAAAHQALDRLGTACGRRLPPLWRRHVASLIAASGQPGLTPERLAARQMVWGIGLAAAALGVQLVGDAGGGATALAALFGFLWPYQSLRMHVGRRRRELTRALPFSLDLMTLAVEAGLDFAQALGRVVEQCDGPLREEYASVCRELRVGRTRAEALRALSDRLGIPAFTSLATSLIQADRMGIPIGKALRLQASQQRLERSQRAEKRAAEAPVKLLFPLVACFFPLLFMVLFGPLVFQLVFGKG